MNLHSKAGTPKRRHELLSFAGPLNRRDLLLRAEYQLAQAITGVGVPEEHLPVRNTTPRGEQR